MVYVPLSNGLEKYTIPMSVLHSVRWLSHVQLFAIPWPVACQASLSITNSQSLLKLISITVVMPSNHLILCCPLLFPPSILPSSRVFSNELVLLNRWPKFWSFSFSISPFNEYSVLISFIIDWLDLLAVQGKSVFMYLLLSSCMYVCIYQSSIYLSIYRSSFSLE